MIIVVTKEEVEVSNQWIKETVDPQAGEFTFTVPLYTGEELTHYWCGINLTDDQIEDMQFFFSPLIFTDLKPNEVLEKLGLNTGATDGGI